jgi:hypothetical protein
MPTISIHTIAVLSLASMFVGCKDKRENECEVAVVPLIERMEAAKMGSAMDQLPAEVKPRSEEMVREMMTAIEHALTDACRSDGWSAEMIACVRRATTAADLDGCSDKLTPLQQENLKKSMAAAAGATTLGRMRAGNHP